MSAPEREPVVAAAEAQSKYQPGAEEPPTAAPAAAAAAPSSAPAPAADGSAAGAAAVPGGCMPAKYDRATAMSICAFGYFGVLIRLALRAFSTWWSTEQPDSCQLLGEIGHGFFLPNILGCFMMGFAKRSAEFHWGRHGLAYTGFTTGLCGCLTTFAT